MRLGLLAASLVLVAGGAVGCGDDSGGGGGGNGSTSTKEFCGALADFQDEFSAADPTKDIAAYLKTLKAAAEKLDEVGTPSGMPSDAQDGFALTIDKIEGLPDDATLDDLSGIGDVSAADQKKLDALDAYIAKTCPDLGGSTDAPSASTVSPPSSSPS
jgi:hypothetical protein